ncbi:hypothetical protein BKA93DRAFT_749071 [Sparassis latifolia]
MVTCESAPEVLQVMDICAALPSTHEIPQEREDSGWTRLHSEPSKTCRNKPHLLWVVKQSCLLFPHNEQPPALTGASSPRTATVICEVRESIDGERIILRHLTKTVYHENISATKLQSAVTEVFAENVHVYVEESSVTLFGNCTSTASGPVLAIPVFSDASLYYPEQHYVILGAACRQVTHYTAILLEP